MPTVKIETNVELSNDAAVSVGSARPSLLHIIRDARHLPGKMTRTI